MIGTGIRLNSKAGHGSAFVWVLYIPINNILMNTVTI
jgi:hypothetical protein